MSDQTKSASTWTDDAGVLFVGDQAWNTSIYGADCALAEGELSHSVYAQGFGFTIPEDATIEGVSVSLSRSAGYPNAIQDAQVRLIRQWGPYSNDQASSDLWPVSIPAAKSYGGSSDLWGWDWSGISPSDVNDSEFGVAVQAGCTGPDTSVIIGSSPVYITACEITIHYTPGEGGSASQAAALLMML